MAIPDIEPQIGLIWIVNVDPTIGPGVIAPPWQFLFRSDDSALYIKTGFNPTDWTIILGGEAAPGVSVQDEGVSIPNNPHLYLNFTGAGVTATDAGAGVAEINIPGGGPDIDAFEFDPAATGGVFQNNGSGNVASGAGSLSEGQGTLASAAGAHAEGVTTEANDVGAHAEGVSTTASNPGSHAEGTGTTAQGDNGHAEGLNTIVFGAQGHAEGASTNARGLNAHAEGAGTDVQLTATNGHAEGDGSAVQGPSNAAHAEGIGTTAEADGAHAEGDTTTAGAHAAHAEGVSTSAVGEGAHAEGDTTSAAAHAAHAEGWNTAATGIASSASGEQSQATQEGERAHASGMFASIGDAQARQLVMRGLTPGAVPGESVELKFGEAADQVLTFTDGRAYNVYALVEVGGVTAGPTRVTQAFRLGCSVQQNGGVLTIDGASGIDQYGSAAVIDWAIAFVVGAGPKLEVVFTTGAVAAQCHVCARIERAEVMF